MDAGGRQVKTLNHKTAKRSAFSQSPQSPLWMLLQASSVVTAPVLEVLPSCMYKPVRISPMLSGCHPQIECVPDERRR